MGMTMLQGGTVFSGVPNCGMLRADVLMEGRLIHDIGPQLPVGDEVTVVDISGCSVLPGLINAHEHLTLKRTYGPPYRQMQLPDAYLVIRGVRAALRDLREGVTTIRECGAKNDINFALKRAIDIRAIPGPRVLVARMLTSVGGHAAVFGRVATGPHEFRAAVREAIAAGADWVKILSTMDPVRRGLSGQHTYPELTEEELGACVDEAHRWCKKVSVHAMGSAGLGQAIRCKPDTIEHGAYLDSSMAKQMAENGIALVPTLSGYVQTMRAQFERGTDWIARHELLTVPHSQGFQAALKAGVTIGVGSDTVGDYVEELQMMVQLGMTTQMALECATRVNATILGLEDEIGTIESGKTADLVVVQGDPLANLEALRSVVTIVKGGEVMATGDVQLCTDDESAKWNTLTAVDVPV